MRIYFLTVLFLASGCFQEQRAPITGVWKCVAVERIETPPGESMAKSFGKEMAKSEKVSDSLIIRSGNIYEEYVSAFGIHNLIKGTYVFSHSDKKLLLLKNDNAPGMERSKDFLIKKLTSDTLLLKDNEGFKLVYLRQEIK